MTLLSVDRAEFGPVPLNSESSAGSHPIGSYAFTMELFKYSDTRYEIEWDIPDIETTEHIGIFLKDNVLTDYDGVFSLPNQAVLLLRKNGIVVPEEFE